MSDPNQATRKLAGRLVVGLEGAWPTPVELAWLKKWYPFGVILFSRNVECFSQLQQLCAVLKDAVPGLRIMADHEGGPVSQMAAAVGRPPVAYHLGALDDTALTFRIHAETGRRLKAAGLDWVLAPCADILSEPRNPVIGARSFGCDPELVSRHVEAAVGGLRSAGISCCLKHWPGHGGSSTDSHLETTMIEISENDETPFQAGICAGAEAIMPGHLLIDDSQWPATLSRNFLDETRRRLDKNKSGIKLIADDVSMGALRQPMARLGVDVPGGLKRGMVEARDLSLAWFEQLAIAGCDLFLVRGLPLLAFPGSSKLGMVPPKQELDPMRKIKSGEDFNAEPYLEAQRHCLPVFEDNEQDLFCLDLARDDRWQVAGALTAEHWTRWDRLWASRFERVLRVTDLDCEVPGENKISWLLVANHRPMHEQWTTSIWAESLHSRLAGTGRCLVMGHPSLENDFQSFLNRGWSVTSLYDVSCEVLI